MIYWFTGQPGAGKSTLAAALQSDLRKRGFSAVHLDGEELREITGNRDYSREGRIANIRAGQKLAAKLSAEGIIVTVSFVSPYRWLREEFKKSHNVVEIYVHTTETRGREKFFVKDYEPPQSDFIDIDTTHVSVEACVNDIWLKKSPGL
jgi:adenylylsulfate kinase-like enzyme